ncbi:hypothetical protein ACEN9X_20935 [Mucilaginibacter sp. Mucisp86]|uniref:hypothetical protein n=1 Tax=Mucilaginibacter sp. Mucisp86 TaxID=3243060 RepID=UPI0039B3AA39
MFEIVTSTKFFKDLKLLKKRSLNDFQLLQNVITTLAKGHTGLDKKYKAHKPIQNFMRINCCPLWTTCIDDAFKTLGKLTRSISERQVNTPA